MGSINDEIASFDPRMAVVNDPPLITHVLVLMAHGIVSMFKEAIGYWPCIGFNSHQLFHVMMIS